VLLISDIGLGLGLPAPAENIPRTRSGQPIAFRLRRRQSAGEHIGIKGNCRHNARLDLKMGLDTVGSIQG